MLNNIIRKEKNMTDKDAYVQKLHAKLDEWNAEIDKLKAKADKAGRIRALSIRNK